MTWHASPSKCATRRASSRPRSRELPPSCGARSVAWTKTISAPACSAVRIGCAAAILRSGRNRSHQRPAKAGSAGQRRGARVGHAVSALPRTPRVNRAMDDLSRLRDQLAGLGGRPSPTVNLDRANNGQGQPGQLSRNGQSGQAGQPGQQQAASGSGWPSRVGQRGEASRRRPGWSGRQSGVGGGRRDGTVYGDYDTGNTRISGQRRERPSKVPIRPIRSARSSRD